MDENNKPLTLAKPAVPEQPAAPEAGQAAPAGAPAQGAPPPPPAAAPPPPPAPSAPPPPAPAATAEPAPAPAAAPAKAEAPAGAAPITGAAPIVVDAGGGGVASLKKSAKSSAAEARVSGREKLTKQKQREERLRQWREEEEAKRNPPKGTAKLYRILDNFVMDLIGKVRRGDDGELDRYAAEHHRRAVKIFVTIVVVILLAVFVLPLAPLQIKRSAGFAALQSGDYPTALSELQMYLIERPQDYDAMYAAAKSALFSGDLVYAQQSIGSIYASGALRDSHVGYYYALFNFEETEAALLAVEQTLGYDSSHLAARLLRGILLGRDPAKAREAREDFLQAGELARANAQELDTTDLQAMYEYFQEKGHLSLVLTLPPLGSNFHSEVSRLLGFSPRFDGFVQRMQYSTAEEMRRARLSPEGTINYFFVDMLLRHNELQEAGSVLEGLERTAGDTLAVAQLAAFYAAAQGDHATAKARMEKVLERLPHDPATINNLATVELLAIDADNAEDKLRSVVGLYRRLIELDPVGVTELGNGAYLALLANDLPTAHNLLDKAAAESTDKGDGNLPPPARLTRGLLAMVEGDVEAATTDLATISEDDIPGGASRYLLAVYENGGNIAAAVTILEQLAGIRSSGTVAGASSHFFDYIRLLCERGEWALALIYLQDYVPANPQDYGARYLFGLTALQFASPELLEDQRALLARLPGQQENAADVHYFYALEAAIAERGGDAALAAENYLRAVASTESSRRRYAYLMAWAALLVDDSPREVAAALRPYMEEYDLPGLRSMMAYALSQTEPETAVRLAQEDAKRHGHSYFVKLYAGAALTRAGRFADGLDLLEAANIQRPGQAKVLQYLKDAYLGVGRERRAERAARTLENVLAQAKSGSNGEGQISYKIHLPENKDIVKAVQDMVVRGTGNYGDVQEAYGLALGSERNTKKRAELMYSKATFEAYNKTYDKAASLFRRALQGGLPTPEMQVQAMLFYFEVLQLTERWQVAHSVVEQLIAVDGEKALYRRMRGQVFESEGKEAEALDTYLALLVDFPTDVGAYEKAANLLLALEEQERALTLLRQLLFVAPANSSGVYELLARTYRIRGEVDKSVQYSNVFSFLDGMLRGG